MGCVSGDSESVSFSAASFCISFSRMDSVVLNDILENSLKSILSVSDHTGSKCRAAEMLDPDELLWRA